MSGVKMADSLDDDFFAYWLIITSCAFYREYDGKNYMKIDPLELLLDVLIDDPRAYAVQPAFTFNEKTYQYFDLIKFSQQAKKDLNRLPYSIRVLLEGCLRNVGKKGFSEKYA